MAKLRKFTDTIRTTKKVVGKEHQDSSAGSAADGDGADGEDSANHKTTDIESTGYHGQVLEEDERNIDPEQEKRELQNWFVGKLKCKRHIDDNYRNDEYTSSSSGGNTGKSSSKNKSSDGRYADDHLVVDPRMMNK